MSESINITLKVWRQKDKSSKGEFKSYEAKNISTHASFLEMLDIINEELVSKGEEPIAFDHDCREGICGMCSMVINGNPHGPEKAITSPLSRTVSTLISTPTRPCCARGASCAPPARRP